MKRRHFLSLTGFVSGSCFIPPAIAQRIYEIGTGVSKPAILGPDNPEFQLYALHEKGRSDFTLHLGDPYAEPDFPTLAEFIDDRGYNAEDDSSLKEYLIEERGEDLDDSAEEVKESIDRIRQDLESPIEDRERSHWLEWNYEMQDSTQARAYHYLDELPLIGSEEEDGISLGEISFIEGDRPGSNLTFCEADGIEAVAALQHRLNELKTGARIIAEEADLGKARWG